MNRFSLVILLTLAVLLPGVAQASAMNECIDACFSGSNCAMSEHNGMNTSDCQSGRDRCVKQCNDNVSRGEAPKPITGEYGAIAYDEKTGAWGLSDPSQSRGDAKDSALGYCGKRGKDCEIVERFSKTCAAVASGTGNRFGYATDDNPRQAGLDAIKKCGDSGSSGKANDKSRCFLQLYRCYNP